MQSIYKEAEVFAIKLSIGIIILTILALIFCSGCYADNYTDNYTNTVYQTIAKEASNQPLEAQILVAKVIRQRAIERKLTPEQVCLQPKQFSCWNKGTIQKPRTEQELKTAEKAWELSADCKESVNLYHDVSVNPYWVSKVKFVKQIGKLKFYKEVR